MSAANDNGKVCTTCGERKPFAEFARDKSKRDGHHTKCKGCVQEYKAANADQINEQRKRYREANADQIAAYMKQYRPQYRERNRDQLVQKSLEWARNNPEKRKVIAQKWRDNNPEASRAIVRNRRARIKASNGSHTAEDVFEIGRAQRWKCACCRVDLSTGYHVDHVVPIAAGGSNGKENLQLLCAPCNLSKNARDPVEFMQSRGFLC